MSTLYNPQDPFSLSLLHPDTPTQQTRSGCRFRPPINRSAAQQADKVQRYLTSRDYDILASLHETGPMTRAQLGVLHWQPGAAESGIRRRLGKLYADYYALNCRDFVMNQLGYIGLEPCCVYVLSNVGMELLMRRVPHVEREAFSAEKQYQLGDGAQLLLHDLMVSQVRVSFQQTQRQWQAKGISVQVGWRNERQSILQHMHKKQENDMPWELSRPDATALFRTPNNLYTYFLELDRGGSDWEAKVKHYHNALRFSNWQRQLGVERFPPILCVLPPEAFSRLGRWLRGQGEQVQYYLKTWPDLLAGNPVEKWLHAPTGQYTNLFPLEGSQ